jgi:hypothetical protein
VDDEAGQVDTVFPPTSKAFAMTQSHWFRTAGGQIIEHGANRDDPGMARQLGWVPPPGLPPPHGRGKAPRPPPLTTAAPTRRPNVIDVTSLR